MSQILRTKSGVCFKTAGTPSERAANARPHAHLGFFMSAAGPAARKLYHKTAAAALLSDIVFPENGKSASICAARQSRLRRLDPESLLFRLPGRYRSSERKAGISPKDVRLGDSLILCGGLPPCICKGHPFAKGEPHSEMLCRRLSWSVSPPKNGAEQSLPPTPRSDKIHERIRPFPKKHLNFPETSCIIAEESAGVMELVDVADSKSAGGFESHHRHHDGPRFISLAPKFFQKSERTYFAAPSLQNRPRCAGLRFGSGRKPKS